MNWYLIRCKANQQLRAQSNLAMQGFDTYTPTLLHERVLRRQRVIRSEPVFPGYIFIQLGAESNWRALRSTRGVGQLVSFNGAPQALPDTLVQALHTRFDAHQAMPLFRPGDCVQITDGCFRHLEAIVKAVTADERIVVLLNILQSQHALVFPVTALARAG